VESISFCNCGEGSFNTMDVVKKTLEITSGTLNDWKNDNIMALLYEKAYNQVKV